MTSTISTVTTLAEAEEQYGVTHLEHLDRDAAIPTVQRLAFQGDVAIIRRDGRTPAATTPVPATGYPVVRGENGGNTHALFGPVHFDPARATANDLSLGTLTVPDGAQALLSHPEHGGLLVDPGTYEVRRQREQADEIRVVAD
jgi:hypothetical protein